MYSHCFLVNQHLDRRGDDMSEAANHQWKCHCTGNEYSGDYSRMVIFEYEGKTYQVDSCMVNEIKWLLKQGIKTIESCCGHHFVIDDKEVMGYILVSEDSVELMCRLGYKSTFIHFMI